MPKHDLSGSNGCVEIAAEALVLVEVLADVFSWGSIGNIKISHLHCSASIVGNVLQYKSIGYVQMLGIGWLLVGYSEQSGKSAHMANPHTLFSKAPPTP